MIIEAGAAPQEARAARAGRDLARTASHVHAVGGPVVFSQRLVASILEKYNLCLFMVMNTDGIAFDLAPGKIVRVRGNWRVGTNGASRSFTSYFSVPNPSGAKAENVKLDVAVKDLIGNFFSKLVTVQSDGFAWTRCVIQPDVTNPLVYASVFDLLPGKLAGNVPSDMEYVVNIIVEKTSQSRNLVLPGVTEKFTDNDFVSKLKADIEAAEGLFVNGVKIGDTVLNYMRLGRANKPERVRGASFQGFRKKKKP